jgi:hypothetical protein
MIIYIIWHKQHDSYPFYLYYKYTLYYKCLLSLGLRIQCTVWLFYYYCMAWIWFNLIYVFLFTQPMCKKCNIIYIVSCRKNNKDASTTTSVVSCMYHTNNIDSSISFLIISSSRGESSTFFFGLSLSKYMINFTYYHICCEFFSLAY